MKTRNGTAKRMY